MINGCIGNNYFIFVIFSLYALWTRSGVIIISWQIKSLNCVEILLHPRQSLSIGNANASIANSRDQNGRRRWKRALMGNVPRKSSLLIMAEFLDWETRKNPANSTRLLRGTCSRDVTESIRAPVWLRADYLRHQWHLRLLAVSNLAGNEGTVPRRGPQLVPLMQFAKCTANLVVRASNRTRSITQKKHDCPPFFLRFAPFRDLRWEVGFSKSRTRNPQIFLYFISVKDRGFERASRNRFLHRALCLLAQSLVHVF